MSIKELNTNSNFLIPIFSNPDSVKLIYFKLRSFYNKFYILKNNRLHLDSLQVAQTKQTDLK